jgi:hypothetical protein
MQVQRTQENGSCCGPLPLGIALGLALGTNVHPEGEHPQQHHSGYADPGEEVANPGTHRMLPRVAMQVLRIRNGLRPLQKPFAVLGLLVLCLSSAGCYQSPSRRSDLSPIVGTWVVKVPEAPFPLHMFVFHSVEPCSNRIPMQEIPIPATATSWASGCRMAAKSRASWSRLPPTEPHVSSRVGVRFPSH